LSRKLSGQPLLSIAGEPIDLDVCPGCGLTLEGFLGTGYVGCPACYSSFSRSIRGEGEDDGTEQALSFVI
jgi:protein-arginine kinase activator protein McsA